MKAITYDKYGGPDVLTVSEIDVPKPASGQVRVAVKAVSVNPMDANIRRGDLQNMFPVQFPAIPGSEVSGTVDEAGPDVTAVRTGDEVVAMTDGGAYAQFALASLVIPKPPPVSWEEAAALPTVAGAAYRALAELAVNPGETLLIHGIAGSVGSVAAQLAVALGITVAGTARAEDAGFVTGLGATPVTAGDGWVQRVQDAVPQGVDAVLDTAGAGLLPDSIELAGGPDRVLTLINNDAQRLGVRFSTPDFSDNSPGVLPQLIALGGQGQLSVRIWRTFPLREAADAHRAIEDHSAHGKIILLP